MGVSNDFSKLWQLILLEEFKNCLPSVIKIYLEEQKTDTPYHASV